MKISDIKYKLPLSLINKYPNLNRDNDRMMVVHRDSGEIEHKYFKDFLSYLSKDDVIVVNNSKIEPSFFYAKKEKNNSLIKVTLVRKLSKDMHMWEARVEPARKIRVGNKIYFSVKDLVAEVLDNTTAKGRTIKFSFQGDEEELKSILDSIGYMPIPEELKRDPEEIDRSYYQTIFADESDGIGIVSPVAGLRFSLITLRKIELNDINLVPITLHISLNNTKKISLEDVSKYDMDSEKIIIKEESARVINKAIENNKKICAIGTSSLRAIESSVSINKRVSAVEYWKANFIYSEHQIKVCNMLLTNFNLPESVSLVMAASFCNEKLIKKAYEAAIRENYKFFVYGDCMLIV
jgi:S-adenosylmethionine:tRNA ribosyltransferase-isomerase